MESSIGVNLRVTAHSNQGGRKYMEDMFCVAYQPTADERDLLYAYFGIFDGHGGRDAASYAKAHLMDFIVSQKNFWSDDDELVKKAIRDGFIATHYAMWKELEKWPKTASGLPSTSGTTASIVFVRRGKMYIGHVGDSGIILGIQDPNVPFWKAKPLTKDHKPENTVENDRITKSGGKVISKSGVPRVVWNRPRIGHKGPVRRSTHIDEIPFLAVARSLGDLWSYNSAKNEFVVSPEPDVSVVEIDVNTHRCIILGSDGLWNMLGAQDAVNSVFYAERNNERQLLSSPPEVATPVNLIGQVKNWINPSKRLVDRALDRWFNHNLRADNTSVVTVVIDPPGPPKAQVLRQSQNRTHVVRQSVSSVTDPATSKTVPAMVLAPMQGPKPTPGASSYTVKATANSSNAAEGRSGVETQRDRSNNSSGNVPASSSGSEVSPSSEASSSVSVASTSFDTEHGSRLAAKRKFKSIGKNAVPENVAESGSTSVCSSNPPKYRKDSMLTRQDAPTSHPQPDRTNRTDSISQSESTPVKSQHQDDVQIHEISSSSESSKGDISTFSARIDDCVTEPPTKRRKFTRSATTTSATTTFPENQQRPLTRNSESSRLSDPRSGAKNIKRKLCVDFSEVETPKRSRKEEPKNVRTTRLSAPAATTTHQCLVVPQRRSSTTTASTSLRTPEMNSSSSRTSVRVKTVPECKPGRSLRSDTRKAQRITRSRTTRK